MPKTKDPRYEPDCPEWDELECANYLNGKLASFTHPAGLICYWRAPKVLARLSAMPEKWRNELSRRFDARLSELNDQGPYIEADWS